MSRMHSFSCGILSFFFITILVLFNYLKKCEARDTIYVGNSLIDDGDSLVSAGGRFELGFFTPQGSHKINRYVGIWYYNLTPRTVVWVANRDDPLPSDFCGIFGIDAEDGNIKLWCSTEVHFRITALENSKSSNRTLRLLDTGNLILSDDQSGRRLWQSFENPTDTFLPGMKMNDNMVLISWTSPSDPHTGDYRFNQDLGVYNIQNGSKDYWKSGEASTISLYDELPPCPILSEYSKQNNYDQLTTSKKYISFPNGTGAFNYNNTRLFMSSSGEIQYYNYSSAGGGKWLLLWSRPRPHDRCNVYNPCGKFAVCSMEKNGPICKCLEGYNHQSAPSGSWPPGQNLDGCGYLPSKCTQEERFSNISFVKVVGGGKKIAKNETGCKVACSINCDCRAYLYKRADVKSRDNGSSNETCWIWTSDLLNLQHDNNGGQNLSLRVPTGDHLPSDSEPTCNLSTGCNDPPYSRGHKNNFPTRYAIALAVLLAGVILASSAGYFLHRKRRMGQGTGNQGMNTEANPVLFSYESERHVSNLMKENDRSIDVPLYSFDTILSATDNFSDSNKLGQGGFGPVYKGTFPGGREIAVKRLSSCSGQGIDEFLNEIVLIAKLQHRNLVRLLGYCIKENEKMLLYEYMPNRSLDAFIFDQHNCLLLNWKKRFEIILGIARGLLYLHQDSRLRIVHRDLKTSNILLDEDMNPKISDFGLARIVQGKGTEASTNKVVGTYGYMSPEYALDGKFSIKSDVFSFGVVMLEIISGKRNSTGFYNPKEVLNLLGYAWRTWGENKAVDLADPTLVLEHHEKSQVMKCINIGLLCVQEDPSERPSMSSVVIMIGSENSNPLPSPSQPAFVVRKHHSSTSAASSSTKPDTITINELTVSIEQGR